MRDRVSRCLPFLVSGCVMGVIAGCGPVDYKSMSPKVWKPGAEILLVNSPLAWQADAAKQLAESAGVWCQVQTVPDSGLKPEVERVVKSSHVGLIVIVVAGPITTQDVALAAPHLGTRFEFVGAAGVPMAAVNVRQLVPDGGVTAYQLGWLAGELAAQQSTNEIGWLTDGTFRLPTTSVKVSLGGVFSANPKVVLSVVGPSAIGQTAVALPHILITDLPLTAGQYGWLTQQGSLVVSLLPAAERGVARPAAEPAVPSTAAIGEDLVSFAKLKWQPGTVGVSQSPVVVTNASAVAPSVLSAVPTITQANSAVVGNAWNQIPAAIRQAWSAMIGVQA